MGPLHAAVREVNCAQDKEIRLCAARHSHCPIPCSLSTVCICIQVENVDKFSHLFRVFKLSSRSATVAVCERFVNKHRLSVKIMEQKCDVHCSGDCCEKKSNSIRFIRIHRVFNYLNENLLSVSIFSA